MKFNKKLIVGAGAVVAAAGVTALVLLNGPFGKLEGTASATKTQVVATGEQGWSGRKNTDEERTSAGSKDTAGELSGESNVEKDHSAESGALSRDSSEASGREDDIKTNSGETGAAQDSSGAQTENSTKNPTETVSEPDRTTSGNTGEAQPTKAASASDSSKNSDATKPSGTEEPTKAVKPTKAADSPKPSGETKPTRIPSEAKPTKTPSEETKTSENDGGLKVIQPSEDSSHKTNMEEGETEAISYKNPNSEGRQQNTAEPTPTNPPEKRATPTPEPQKTAEPTKTPEENALDRVEELESDLKDLFIDLGNGAYELPEDIS